MAWSAPSSVSTGDLITAATWNADVVDNVQYVHDNRSIFFLLSADPNNVTSNGAYQTMEQPSRYKGSMIDESDLDSLIFVSHLQTANVSGSAFVQVYDVTGTAAITGTELTTTITTATNVEESADIKANWPTVDSTLQIQIKNSDSVNTEAKWNGAWLDF